MYKPNSVLVCLILFGSVCAARSADLTSVDFPNAAVGTTTQIDGGSFDIQGSGVDLWNSSDQGRFVYQTVSGDFRFTAQVSSLQQTDPWSKAAVMVRASTSPDSIDSAMVVSGSNGFGFQYRDATGGESSWTGGGANTLPNSWIRIIRTGSTVAGLESSDGVHWHIVSTVTLNLPQTVVAGMAVTSHNPSLLCLAQFRNVELVPYSTPGPADGFTSQDVNTYYVGSTVALSPDSVAVTGGGNDQWGNSDGIRLAYSQQDGNFDIRCKILSLENIDSWSKAGLTVRHSTDPSSTHASILATPANGLVFQNRDTFGGLTNSAYLGSVTPGLTWIRLIKYQNTVTAYRSDDNIVWDQAAQVAWNDASPVLAGMVVTAHNDGALCTAQFGGILLKPYTLPQAGTGDGLTGTYFNTNDLSGLPVLTQVDATVDHNYGGGTPAPGVNSTNFSVRWTGQVQTQYDETYSFYTVSDDGIRLWVNGNLLIDNWTYHGSIENKADIALLAGNKYDIAVEYFQGFGGSVAQLLWSSPSTPKEVIPQSQLYSSGDNLQFGNGAGLFAQYFNAPDLSSPAAPFNIPVLSRVDPAIDFDWSQNSPDSVVTQTNFSARWIGQIQPQYDELYTFYVTADDGVRLWVNNILLVDGWVDQPATTYTGSIALKAGEKVGIKMEYYQRYGGAVAKLEWSSPTRARITVPASQLYSDSGIAVPIPATSVVSPAFIEGISWAPDGNPYTITASSQAGSVSGTMISDNNWFANVPLNTDGSATPVTATQTSTSGTATGSIVWWPLDLAGSDASDHNIVIRKGDSLLLTANGNGESLLIDADGDGVVDFVGVPGQKLPFQYNVAGTFVAQAKIDDALAGTLVVTVMDVDLTTRIADEVDFQRKCNVTVTPDTVAQNIVFEPADPVSLQVGATDSTLNPVSVSLSALKRGMPTLVARLNAGGPIISAKRVNEFTLDSQALRGALINLSTNTGGTILNMRPYIPNIRIEFDLFAHTSTFAGGATSLSFNTSDIDPTTDRPLMKQVYDPTTKEYIGQYFLELDVPPGETKYCFNIHAFDEAGGTGTGIAVSRDAGSSGGGQVIAQNTNLNGCTCKGSVSPVTLCVNENGSFTVGLQLDDPTMSNNCAGPFLVDVQSTGVKFTDPSADRTMYCGETESFEIEGLQFGTYSVSVGGVPFAESITVVEVDLNPETVTVCLGSSVTFTATVNPDGGSFLWSAGADTPDSGNESSFTTSYDSVGDKTVTLSYTVNGHACNKSATVHVFEIVSLDVTGADAISEDDYATPIAASGDVIITAVTNPDISGFASSLQDGCISWSGGLDGGDQLHRKVTKTIAAQTDVTATCGTSSATANIYVAEIALLDVEGADAVSEDEYATQIAQSGNVKLTAVTTPDISSFISSLPAGFVTWSGGSDGDDQLHHKVDKTIAAKTEVTATCGTSSASATIYVVEVVHLDVEGANAISEDEYATQIAASGDVAITAVTYPDISGFASSLPDDFIDWFGGTDSDDPLHRKVTKTVAGKTDVLAQCGISNSTATIYVVEVTLLTVDGAYALSETEYATPIVASGDVSITAVTNPDISGFVSSLPSGFVSWNGGGQRR